MAQNFGVVNTPSDAPVDALGTSGPNSALEVTNATVVEVLTRHATRDTPEPFLMYLQENITLWPRADWPAGGLKIMRPVFIIGWTYTAISLDLGNCAGCAALGGRWSNITFDSVVLENLGYGDPRSPVARSYSSLNSRNIWFFNYTR
jgi:hypothetical protein